MGIAIVPNLAYLDLPARCLVIGPLGRVRKFRKHGLERVCPSAALCVSDHPLGMPMLVSLALAIRSHFIPLSLIRRRWTVCLLVQGKTLVGTLQHRTSTSTVDLALMRR